MVTKEADKVSEAQRHQVWVVDLSKNGSVLSKMSRAQKVKPGGFHFCEVPRCQTIWNQEVKYFEWGIHVSLGRCQEVLWIGC